MTRLSIGSGVALVIAASLFADAASAASKSSVVPPENSAAAQYTEAVPTAGGDKPTGGGGAGGHRSPAKVLGAHDAHKLQAQGKSGHEVAEVVAATAPETSSVEPHAATEAPAAQAKARSGDGSSSRRAPAKGQGIRTKPAQQKVRATTLPSGSSGLGEVLAAATGSSSEGQLGALLPLAIAASIAWALAYLWRQRRRTS